MGNSKIEWTDKVWNPITGCTPISEGCVNCYAARMAKRLAGRYGYPKDNPFKPGTIHSDKFHDPQHWKKPCNIFVCSMGDLFHEEVSGRLINEVWIKVFNNPQHTYYILTKRPERLWDWTEVAANYKHWPIEEIWQDNVWLGITAENQVRYDERIPWLKKLKDLGWKTFVSLEPLLGPIKLDPTAQDLVIVGGETGPGWRLGAFESMDQWIDEAWAIRKYCQARGIPFFFKKTPGGGQPPDDLNIREQPKGSTPLRKEK